MDIDLLWALPGRVASRIVEQPSGCWIWTGSTIKGGYGRPSVNGRHILLHRLTWTLANGPIPKGRGYHGTCVLHQCDVPACCNPAHLFLGTNQDNMDDRNRKGRQNKGTAVNTAKLSEYDVISIRRKYAAGGISLKSLSIEYGMGETTIGALVHRKTWKHI